ncbi:MAG TPA: hypothetical protein VGI74_12605 [Streptosporangiaceae bacterium]
MRGSHIAVAVAVAAALTTALSGGTTLATINHGPSTAAANPAQALIHHSITQATNRTAHIAVAQATAPAATTAPPRGRLQGKTVIISCLNRPEVRPDFFMLACSDGTAYLTKLRWASWTASLASGTAEFSLNRCDPSCATGKFITSPVVIVLWRTAAVPRRPSRQQFLRMTIIYTGKRPAGSAQSFTEPLWYPTGR